MNGYDVGFQQGMPVVTPRTLGRRGGNEPAFSGRPGTVGGGRPLGLGGSYPAHSQSRSPVPGQTNPWDKSLRSPHNNPNTSHPAALAAIQARQSGGVRPGTNMMGGPSVGSPMGQPSLEQIQAQMARRQVGAQLGPRNGALAGYMMG